MRAETHEGETLFEVILEIATANPQGQFVRR
jgi:hypothetical protein